MRNRIKKSEPCYMTRHNENCEIFGVNLISYDERSAIAKEKRQRIAEINKKKEEKKKEEEKYFSYSLFGKIFYKPMKLIGDFRDFVLEENLVLPSMTVE